MRISDWSSDVCSSDLVVRRVLAGIGFLVRLEAAMLGDVEQGCGEFVVGQPAFEAVRTRLPRVRRLVAVAGNLACLRLGFPLCNGNPAPLMEGIGIVRLEQRSEEHTSELQSLMRISYAVFCLK